jgi:hypothetical protein
MGGEAISPGCEMAVSHSIDKEQAEFQIEQCERKLYEEEAKGNSSPEARRYLRMARECLESGLITRAFLLAVRARGLAVERIPLKVQ